MLPVIEKLLILQDRDRKILRLKAELHGIDPERRMLQTKITEAHHRFESAKTKANQIESQRKDLEVQVEAKKQQIEKYSLQQFQTKKNDEYRALAKEIDNCRQQIVRLDDQQLELMEQGEAAHNEAVKAEKLLKESKSLVDSQVAALEERETQLKTELAELERGRNQLLEGIDEQALSRYERLLRHKGEKVIVGVDHGVCGGCHMKLPIQVVLSCQAQQEIINCPNCGRILFYTRDMDLAVAE